MYDRYWIFIFQIHIPGVLPKPELEWDYNLGDVILGMPAISEGCVGDDVRLVDRLPVIVTHGLCHLIGYHHGNKTQWNEVYYVFETLREGGIRENCV